MGWPLDDGSTYPEWDVSGHRYPETCRTDLTKVPATVRVVPEENMKSLWKHFNKTEPPGRLYGFTAFATLPQPTIYVADSMKKEMIDATIHHERCHVKEHTEGRNVHWHPQIKVSPLKAST